MSTHWKILFTIMIALVCGFGVRQSFAMEPQEFILNSFMRKLLTASSDEDFQASNDSNMPVSAEDILYCSLCRAIRFYPEQIDGCLDAMDGFIKNQDGLSRDRHATVLKMIYHFSYHVDRFDVCIKIAKMLVQGKFANSQRFFLRVVAYAIIENKSEELVQGLLPLISDINAKISNIDKKLSDLANNPSHVSETTLLHIAVERGSLGVVKLIGSHKDIDFMVRDSRHKTPMHYAARFDNDDKIKLLVSLGAYINPKDEQGCTPLLHAADAGSLPVIQFLSLQEDTDLKACANSGNTAVHLIRQIPIEKAEPILEILLKAGLDINGVASLDQTTLLDQAIYHKNFPLVLKLLEHPALRISTVSLQKSVLMLSNVILALTEQLAEASAQQQTGAQQKLNNGLDMIDKIMANILSHPSIDPVEQINEMTCLHIAAARNYKAAVKKLLGRKDIDVNALDGNTDTPLHIAAHEGYDEIVELLLTHPAIDPNIIDDEYYTPLHLAAEAGHSYVVQALLRHDKVQVSSKNYQGANPLEIAIHAYMASEEEEDKGGLSRTIALLFRASAMFGFAFDETICSVLKKIFQQSFVEVLISENYLAILQEVVQSSGNINQKDAYGATLLMYMAGQGCVEAVEFLLDQGANPLTLDTYENSALSLVRTIIRQTRYRLMSAPDEIKDAIADEIQQYETIEAMLVKAQIEAVTTTRTVVRLGYLTELVNKRKSEDIAEPVAKRIKREKREKPQDAKIVIPTEFNLFDTLPDPIIMRILNPHINYNS